MKLFATVVVATAAFGLIPMAWADDPSLHEVYQAVHEGRLNDAQSMMTKVLHDHPDSAKAHYVEAEVLAHLQRSDDAEAELEHADRLAPGLPFAKPEAVRDLRGLIAERGRGRVVGVDRAAGSMGDVRTAESAFPWGAVLIVLGAGLVLFLFLRARRSAVVPMSGAGSAIGPAGSAYGVSPYGAAPMGGGGIGSSIVGGLATCAAVGVAWWPARHWRTSLSATMIATGPAPTLAGATVRALPITTGAVATSVSAIPIPGTAAATTSPAAMAAAVIGAKSLRRSSTA